MDASAPSLSALLTARLRVDGDKPLLTAYDLDTGERTELSVATVDNWVSKAANHLVEELGLSPGEPVGLRLGTAWTTPVLLLACWRVGAVPVVDGAGSAAPPAVLYVAEDRLAELPAEAAGAEVLVVGRGLGARLSPDAPPAAARHRLFADEVLAFADDHDDSAVDGNARGWADPPLTQTQLVARAATWPPDARVLSTAPAGQLPGAVALAGALATGGSLVLVRGAQDATALGRIADDERATHLHDGTAPPRPR